MATFEVAIEVIKAEGGDSGYESPSGAHHEGGLEHLPAARLAGVIGCEEAVVARVDAQWHMAPNVPSMAGAAVLELAREGAVARRDVLDLRRERVAARDRADGAVVAAREVLRAARVLGRGHGADLGEAGEGDDLKEACA